MSLHDIPILYQDILPDAHMYRCYECSWQCSHGDLNNTPAYRLTIFIGVGRGCTCGYVWVCGCMCGYVCAHEEIGAR